MNRLGFRPKQAAGIPLGRIVIKPKSSDRISSDDIIPALSRHMFGDWGIVDKHRRAENRIALSRGKSLHSVYCSNEGVRFRIVTNSARSVTSVEVI